MTRAEFLQWMQFYKRWPFDDFHRFHRPAALVAGAMNGAEQQQLLDYLQPPVYHETFNDLDRQIMAAFGYKAK